MRSKLWRAWQHSLPYQLYDAIIGFMLVLSNRVPAPLVREDIPLADRLIFASNAIHGKRR